MSYFDDLTFVNIARRREPGSASGVFRVKTYSIEFLREGSFVLMTNGRQRRFDAPMVFWMLPDNTYQFLLANDQPLEHFWTDFYGPRAQRMMRAIATRVPDGAIKMMHVSEFTAVFAEMVKVFDTKPSHRRFEAVVGLERLAGMIYDCILCHDQRNEHRYEFIDALAREIRLYPTRDYDFKAHAARNGLSYHRFRKLFKDYNQAAPHDYLLISRMEYAAQLLLHENIAIKALAQICGFEQTSSFSRMFKRKMGIAPTSFAETARKRQKEVGQAG